MEDFEKAINWLLTISRSERNRETLAYLDSIENIMSLDDLDIFRQEKDDHEENGEPFDRSDDLISGDRR